MGLEALVAVGLASNVVQFADFASRLVVAAWKLYESANGRSAQNEELELLARNLRDLAESENLLQLAQNTQSDVTLSTSESEIWEPLNSQCMQLAEDLIKLLGTLEVKGEHRRLESVYRALRTAWKQDDLDTIQKRLDMIGNELKFRIRERQQAQISQQLKELAEENDRLKATRADEIKQLKRDFFQSFEELKQGLAKEGSLTRAWLELPIIAERGKSLLFEQYLLNRLRFSTMDNRQAAIPDEHARTFQWVFSQDSNGTHNPSVNFVQWLRNGEGPYWITGKPGSGKSTLMKFINSHTDVEYHLKSGARDQTIVMGSYYFWSSAKDHLQKSHIGLMRSMLYQILLQWPQFIHVAFPTGRTAFETQIQPDFGLDIIQSLLSAFQRILDLISNSKTVFAFFVDGLDEYYGKPADIIRLIKLLASSPQVRICVSSRPWNEFDADFGIGNPWKLYVHDLTKDDIRMYAQDVLGQHELFQELRKTDDRCPDLVEDIVNAAEGVFLWVFLVVRSLLEGLTNADRIIDLQKRLREIPTDLEEYFESILYTVDIRYREQMADTFMVTLEAHCNLPLLGYWFMDEQDADPEYLFKMPNESSSEDVNIARVYQMDKRLNARCKGLLETRLHKITPRKRLKELGGGFTLEVDFLHRTVKDFLAIETMKRLLKKWSSDSLNIDFIVCSTVIMLVKSGLPLQNSQPVQRIMPAFFHHIKNLQGSQPYVKLRPRLIEEILSALHTRSASTNVFTFVWDKDHSHLFPLEVVLLIRCVYEDLGDYSACTLKKHSKLIREYGAALIAAALKCGDERVEMLRLVLEKGANPNQDIFQPEYFLIRSIQGQEVRDTVQNTLPAIQSTESIWTYYMKSLHELSSPETQQSFSTYNCLKLLLTYGGGPIEDSSCAPCEVETLSNIGSLQDTLTEEQFETLQDIRRRRREGEKSTKKNTKDIEQLPNLPKKPAAASKKRFFAGLLRVKRRNYPQTR